jgi:anti-sigma regulatory factor (Ser/Thr protein kinase)
LDQAVRIDELAAVRGRVQRLAASAGLRDEAKDGFTFAVNEAVVNALEHGGGSARVRVWRDGQLVCEVRDRGGGLPSADTSKAARPAVTQERGRGLWLARQVAEGFTINRDHGDTAVRITAARPRAGSSAAGRQ